MFGSWRRVFWCVSSGCQEAVAREWPAHFVTAPNGKGIEVKDTILARNPHRNNRTFYNQVFIALTRSNLFKKQKSGRFTLDEKAVSTGGEDAEE